MPSDLPMGDSLNKAPGESTGKAARQTGLLSPLWRQLLESVQTCQLASLFFCSPLDTSGSILFEQAFSGFQLPDRIMPTPVGLTSNTATPKG